MYNVDDPIAEIGRCLGFAFHHIEVEERLGDDGLDAPEGQSRDAGGVKGYDPV